MKEHPAPQNYSGPLKGVILDWAGTVIDYGSCAPVAAFREVFRGAGVEITVTEAREPMGMAKRDHIAAVLALPAVRERWTRARGGSPTDDDVDHLYGQFQPAQLRCLTRYGELIPGTVDTIATCRRRGLKIGSSTGYTRQLMEVVLAEAARQGFQPDAVLCADDIHVGRPAPWMCFENARRMDIFPMSAIVKVDDTSVGVEAGRNAGMWSVGVTLSGNLVGLTLDEIQRHDPEDLRGQIAAAEERLRSAGAHFTVNTIADLPPVLDEIESRLRGGETP